MSAANFEFEAQIRDNLGKGASRRLRREEKVLGVVYGGGEAATSIMLEQRHVAKALENEAVYTHILKLKVNGKTQKVVLRDLQRHPYKATSILHIDFLRVSENDMLNMHIPLHFVGAETCPGVLNGGILNHLISDVEVRCQAGKLPEHIDVDVSALELDGSIHLSQLKVPAGVELVMLTQNHDLSVVSVHLPRQSKTDEEEASAAAASTTEAAAEEATDDEKNKDHKK
jgi:large subunit ribosomal protein L25